MSNDKPFSRPFNRLGLHPFETLETQLVQRLFLNLNLVQTLLLVSRPQQQVPIPQLLVLNNREGRKSRRWNCRRRR